MNIWPIGNHTPWIISQDSNSADEKAIKESSSIASAKKKKKPERVVERRKLGN